MLQPTSQHISCPECNRQFRREGDRIRHRCVAKRQKPVYEQAGVVQCEVCSRWFRSFGGLAVHTGVDADQVTQLTTNLDLTPPHGGSRGRYISGSKNEGRKEGACVCV